MIADSNLAGDMAVSLACCDVRYRSLRLADPTSRVVPPTVVCHCVGSRNLKNEAVLVRVWLLSQRMRCGEVDPLLTYFTGGDSQNNRAWSACATRLVHSTR